MKIRIAGAQIPESKDVDSNVATISRAIDFAGAEKADLLLTPEGSLSGYTHQFDVRKVAIALKTVIEKARAAGIGLALGTCFVEPEDKQCYNQLRFYNSKGDFQGFHSKTLKCGTLTEGDSGEINHYAVKPLRTFSFNGITIGGLICNDLWANPSCTPMPDPHLTQQLAKMGARILLHAVNGGRSASERSRVWWQYHEANLRARAMAGRVWIVVVDNCYPADLPCSTPCGIIDPDGDWIVRTKPMGEQLFAHTIHIPD